jgi:hypothetical protein
VYVVRYEVLTAMNMDIMVVQDVTLCNSVVSTNTAQEYAVSALQAETEGTYLHYIQTTINSECYGVLCLYPL